MGSKWGKMVNEWKKKKTKDNRDHILLKISLNSNTAIPGCADRKYFSFFGITSPPPPFLCDPPAAESQEQGFWAQNQFSYIANHGASPPRNLPRWGPRGSAAPVPAACARSGERARPRGAGLFVQKLSGQAVPGLPGPPRLLPSPPEIRFAPSRCSAALEGPGPGEGDARGSASASAHVHGGRWARISAPRGAAATPVLAKVPKSWV